MTVVTVIDYGAGNIRSLVNALKHLGYEVRFVERANDIESASRLIFPGVGAFGSAMDGLNRKEGIVDALKKYLQANRPYLGICIGLQTLFAASEESPHTPGLGLIPATIKRFDFDDVEHPPPVPHMGWNGLKPTQNQRYYFVHSYAAFVDDLPVEWTLATTEYGERRFVSVVRRGNILATQFHPEKSGSVGLDLIRRFVEGVTPMTSSSTSSSSMGLSMRVIACLDVRSNDDGDLVVTKGDHYDVRERKTTGCVRNLGKPVDLAARYYKEGADEITFLNITSFRGCPIRDQPMLDVLRRASENVFVPLTVGGGIRDVEYVDESGTSRHYSALEIATEYFKSGADKVSIGSDAVFAAQAFLASGRTKTGKTSIELIAKAYGRQAVVISVDPKREYVEGPSVAVGKHVIQTSQPGPNGELYCWYRCTINGGRRVTDLDVWDFVQACEELGAGEILLNSIDRDGTKSGYDVELISDVKKAVRIPVIASSGAGCVEHFSQVFARAKPDAVLAAGIFHRREVSIESVKKHLYESGIPVRLDNV